MKKGASNYDGLPLSKAKQCGRAPKEFKTWELHARNKFILYALYSLYLTSLKGLSTSRTALPCMSCGYEYEYPRLIYAHILKWSTDPGLSLDLDNVGLLCPECDGRLEGTGRDPRPIEFIRFLREHKVVKSKGGEVNV